MTRRAAEIQQAAFREHEDAVTALRKELLPRALVVTPNIPEAEALSGITITSLDEASRGVLLRSVNAGTGVVMANAPLTLREIPGLHPTASNVEDGVALAIERFILSTR